jgi:hypothetical protein
MVVPARVVMAAEQTQSLLGSTSQERLVHTGVECGASRRFTRAADPVQAQHPGVRMA